MSGEGFNEFAARRFLNEIEHMPTAFHTQEQLRHAEEKTTAANLSNKRGEPMRIRWMGRRVGILAEVKMQKVENQFIAGMYNVVNSIRRGFHGRTG